MSHASNSTAPDANPLGAIAYQALERARHSPTSRRFWTNREIDLLKDMYPDHPAAAVAQKLNRQVCSVHSKANALGIKKSEAFLHGPHSGRLDGVRGAATRFQKGHTTWNTGKSVPTRGRTAETQFAKGQMPHNHVPVGTEVVSTEGYLKLKVAEPNQWEWCHRRNWEAVHGEIPKGMALIFRSDDRRNCSIENLELVSRSELMGRNTIQRFPPELQSTIRLLGKLDRVLEAGHE